jgi:hypothetical protein
MPHVEEKWSRITVAVTGSSGLIGSALVRALRDRGAGVRRVVRRDARGPDEISWHPDRGTIDAARLERVDAVVNLAGETIGRRWTSARKEGIRASRVRGTALLSRALASLSPRPRVLVSASAVGFYGSRGSDVLDESSAPGADFLASVCADWEAATHAASDAGIRVVHLRTGMVLSRAGGGLAKLLPLFRLGLGGRMGRGDQWLSWISLDDAVEAIVALLGVESPAFGAVAGPVNLVAPEPVTNGEFTRVLAAVLSRPAALAVPRVALELMLGEMARETVLASQRALPRRLLEAGFEFRYPGLAEALRATLRAAASRDSRAESGAS